MSLSKKDHFAQNQGPRAGAGRRAAGGGDRSAGASSIGWRGLRVEQRPLGAFLRGSCSGAGELMEAKNCGGAGRGARLESGACDRIRAGAAFPHQPRCLTPPPRPFRRGSQKTVLGAFPCLPTRPWPRDVGRTPAGKLVPVDIEAEARAERAARRRAAAKRCTKGGLVRCPPPSGTQMVWRRHPTA